MINHFEYHSELSLKSKLFENMKTYCQHHHININEIIPTSFILDLESEQLDLTLKSFLKTFYKCSKDYENLSDKQKKKKIKNKELH